MPRRAPHETRSRCATALATCALFACLPVLIATLVEAEPRRSPDNVREFFAYLDQCVKLPASAEGSELTLRFSVTHYGALRGKPMITYSKLVGDARAQQDFVAAALHALDACTPVPVTERFGRIIGEKMLTWRVRAVSLRGS